VSAAKAAINAVNLVVLLLWFARLASRCRLAVEVQTLV
jgi:hypothetical protein